MDEEGGGRSKAFWLAIAGAVLLVVSAVGGFAEFAVSAMALPLGLVLLLMAFVLARRRSRRKLVDSPPQNRAERRRAFAFRLLILGLALICVAALIAVVGGNLRAAGMFIPPVVIAIVLGTVVVLTARSFIGVAVLGALLLLFALASFELELRHPEAFANFVPAMWLTIGCAITVGAALVAASQFSTRSLRPATRRQRALVWVDIAALVAGSAVSWFASGASRVTAAKAKGAPVVEMHDNEFIPNEAELVEGDVARFYLVNKDSEPHTFTVDELALDEYIGPLGERLVSFDVPSRTDGELALTCVVSGHEDMDGILRVEPG